MTEAGVNVELIAASKPRFYIVKIIYGSGSIVSLLEQFGQNGNFSIEVYLATMANDVVANGVKACVNGGMSGCCGDAGGEAMGKPGSLCGDSVYVGRSSEWVTIAAKVVGS